jgi:hypothetical protein
VDLNQQAAVVGLIDGRSRSHNTAVMFVTHQIFDFTDYSQSLQSGPQLDRGRDPGRRRWTHQPLHHDNLVRVLRRLPDRRYLS